MVESSKNNTSATLLAGRSFVGGNDDCLGYNLTQFQITASTNCIITVFQSNNLSTYVSSQITYTSAGTTQTYSIPLSCRYVRFNIQNNTLVNQTLLNLNVLYRNSAPIGKKTTLLWTTVSTGINGFSAIIDNSLNNAKTITFSGTVDGATVLTLQTSVSGQTFYSSQTTLTTTEATDVGWTVDCAAPYVRIVSSADVATLLYATSV